MSTTNTQIDREALRRDCWQVIETEEERLAAGHSTEPTDESYNSYARRWLPMGGRYRFLPEWIYRRRIPAPVEPARGWVSTKDRLPTEADADECGRIWTCIEGGSPYTLFFEMLEDEPTSALKFWMSREKRAIPPLPEPVKPTPTQEELDEEEAARLYHLGNCRDSVQILELRRAYLAGLRAGRQSDSTRARGGKGAV